MRGYRIAEQTAVMDVRRQGSELARSLGFSEEDCGRVALILTELGTNLLKHAQSGEILIGPARVATAHPCLDILALDQGPGMDLRQSLRDGYSTAGSSGTGLGAVQRQSTAFDAFTTAGHGTAIHVQVCPGKSSFQSTDKIGWGALVRPLPGEEMCGDAVAVKELNGRFIAMVIDGLGHGAFAADAAQTAADIFGRNNSPDAEEIVNAIHAGLRATRGAAVAVTVLEPMRGLATFCGIGNIAGTLVSHGFVKKMVSQNGTAGLVARRIQGFQYPISGETLLVMHSDGLSGSWTLAGYPGLAQSEPTLIASVLYRDFGRSRDDASVLVARTAA